MKYWKVTRYRNFFDGHGEQYNGGKEIFITTDERFTTLNEDAYYWEDFKDEDDWEDNFEDHWNEEEDFKNDGKPYEVDMDTFYGTADGYLSCLKSFEVVEIDETEKTRIEKILKDYEELSL